MTFRWQNNPDVSHIFYQTFVFYSENCTSAQKGLVQSYLDFMRPLCCFFSEDNA